MDYERFLANQENKQVKIFIGEVSRVDSEAQLMDVSLYGLGVQLNVAINNPISVNGAGFRYMPIPRATRVILYEQAGLFYHIGYYFNQTDIDKQFIGLQPQTNNASGDKKGSENSYLQRNLNQGEVSIAGITGSEIYLPTSGSILLINSSRVSIELDAINNAILSSSANIYNETNGVVSRSGNVLRRTKGSQKNLEGYYLSNGVILPETNIKGTDFYIPLNEFSIDVGTPENLDTGLYDDGSEPTVGRFSLADVVLGNDGSPIYQDNQQLQFLLDIIKTNVRICTDETGTFKIVDTTLDKDTVDGMSFTVGSSPEMKFSIGNSSIVINDQDAIYINNNNATINISSTGLIQVKNKKGNVNIYPDGKYEIKNDNTQVTSTNEGSFLIKAKEMLQLLSSGADAGEKTILGETLTAFLVSWIDDYIKHTHPTSIGPTSPPTTSATVSQLKTQYLVDSGEGIKIQSKKTTNN